MARTEQLSSSWGRRRIFDLGEGDGRAHDMSPQTHVQSHTGRQADRGGRDTVGVRNRLGDRDRRDSGDTDRDSRRRPLNTYRDMNLRYDCCEGGCGGGCVTVCKIRGGDTRDLEEEQVMHVV